METPGYPVLIADDSEVDRYFLKRALQSGAAKLRVVAEVQSGDQVVDYFSGRGPFANRRKYPVPDLLILDSRMPRMTGLQVLQWLRAHPVPDLKVAMFADSSGLALEPQARALGASHFFSKLVDSDELLETVKELQTAVELGRAIKVVLQHKLTFCYFQAPDRWTPLIQEAHNFELVEAAVQCAREQELAGVVDVCLVYAASRQRFVFPIPAQE